MAKRSSLFDVPSLKASESAVAPQPDAGPPVTEKNRRYPVAKSREGKRVATVYLDREALRQLQKIAFDEETTLQSLLTEGINGVFAARGLSRLA